MDTDSSILYVIIAVLIALSAIFSSAETAFMSTNRIRLRNLHEDGEKQAGLVLSMLENQNKLISSLLVGNNIVNISASAIATKIATDLFNDAGVGIATGVMTLLVLVFGEVIPKNLAAAHAESWAMFIAPFIRVVSIVLTPLVFLLTKLSDFVVRFSKKYDDDDSPTITEDEFRLLVDVGQEEGVFDESESEMINSIMEFDEIVVKEIMVPRIDIVGLDGEDNVNEALRPIIDGGHSRIPVYEDSIDNIIGILYAKDIFAHMNEDFEQLKVKTLIRNAYYIPETKKVDDLLDEMSDYELDEETIYNIYTMVGSYVFETARRNYGGKYYWIQEEQQPILVVGEPDFSVSIKAWEKVQGRLEKGVEDNIPFYIKGLKEHVERGKLQKGVERGNWCRGKDS